jgi:hypothetical protein
MTASSVGGEASGGSSITTFNSSHTVSLDTHPDMNNHSYSIAS